MALPKLYEQITWVNNTTPALNEDNLNAMSQALDDIDDRVIDLAGTIMEDVPQIQEDMEILGPAVENIDENVARAEAAAESAEQYAEEIAPPIEVVKDYTSIITLSDAINKAAKDVKVKVEAVQDLHGYTKPWVGGAGKNKLQITPRDDYGMVITNENGRMKITGKSTGNPGSVAIGDAYTSGVKKITVKRISGIASNWRLRYVLSKNGTTVYTASNEWTGLDLVTEYTRNIETGYDYDKCQVVLVASTDVEFNTIYEVMVCDTSATMDFESYSNICPITGHSQAKLTRDGHNLLPYPYANMSYSDANLTITANSDGSITMTGAPSSNKVFVLTASRDYDLGALLAGRSVVFTAGASSITGVNINLEAYNSSNTRILDKTVTDISSQTAFTVPAETVAVRVNLIVLTTHSGSHTIYPLLRLASDTKTAYEKYQGEIFTINLDGTRCGGVLDVDAGTLTIDRVYEEHTIASIYQRSGNANCDFGVFTLSEAIPANMYSSTLVILDKGRYYKSTTETFDNISQSGVVAVYSQANKQLAISVPKGASLADAQSMFGTIGIVYPLATPQTITLTPTEIDLLFGYNTLFADTGDLSLTYDASGVLRIANAKLDTDTFKSIVAASSDFADFKSRVAAL